MSSSDHARPAFVSAHPNARIVQWMPEEKSTWIVAENTEKGWADLRGKGAMFVSYFATSEVPSRAVDESVDLINRSPIRYGHLNFDLDSKDGVAGALAALRTLIKRLVALGVPENQILIYYSGAKGFHVVVRSFLIGAEAVNGDRFLNRIYLHMARELAQDIPEADLGIYNKGKGRQFRLPNVKRPNGRHKIPLMPQEVDEEFGLAPEEIEKLAEQPRVLPSINGFSGPVPALRAMYLKARRQSRKDLVREEVENEPLTPEQQKAAAKETPACVKHILGAKDYSAFRQSTTFNEICFAYLAPYYKMVGADLEEAVQSCMDFLVDFEGSATYTTPEAREAEFREKAWKSNYPWRCGIARRKTGCDCSGCAVRQLELREMFPADLEQEEEQAAARAFLADGADKAEILTAMNAMHGVINLGDKIRVTWERPGVDGETCVSFLSDKDMHLLYANKLVPSVTPAGNPTTIPASRAWLAWGNRKIYTDVGFYPPKCPKPVGALNLFQGFRITPGNPDPAKFALYKFLVEDIICGGDPVIIKYTWDWLADLYQNAGKHKPQTALALMGGRGAGKGTFVMPHLRILGQHGIQVAGKDGFLGRFNGHFADKLLVIADEAHWAGDVNNHGKLKNLISESTLAIERKGIDMFDVRSFNRVIMCSNESWVVPAGPDERRFLVYDVSDDKAQNIQWFGELRRELDEGGLEALFGWLLARDLTGVNLYNCPVTAALVDQKVESFSLVEAFWHQCLDDGCFQGENGVSTDGWPERIRSKTLYKDFQDYCRGRGVSKVPTDKALGRRLFGVKGFCPDAERVQVRDGSARPWEYILPSLTMCRKAFEKRVVGLVFEGED